MDTAALVAGAADEKAGASAGLVQAVADLVAHGRAAAVSVVVACVAAVASAADVRAASAAAEADSTAAVAEVAASMAAVEGVTEAVDTANQFKVQEPVCFGRRAFLLLKSFRLRSLRAPERG
jgi:hypothetical protein